MHASSVKSLFQLYVFLNITKMLIEIKDREPYIKKCKATLARIKAVRAKEDQEYEEKWRRQWPERYWRNATDKPPEKFPFYPAVDGWRQQGIISQVLKALESEGTGIIQITKEELDYLD